MAKIYIDPGHNASGADTGAVGFGLKEQDVSVQIGVMLRDMLIASGQTVKMSREHITDTISSTLNGSLSARYNGANSWGADLFISIHCNAANAKAYGCETYHCTDSTKGAELAKVVQSHLVAETGRANRGVKSAKYAVIKHTNMPAILVETAFIDNYEDNQFLASESGKKACAMAIYKGVCDYLGIGYTFGAMEETTESEDNEMNEKIAELENRIKALENPMIYNYIDENTAKIAPDCNACLKHLVNIGVLKGKDEGKLELTEGDIRIYITLYRAGVYGN